MDDGDDPNDEHDSHERHDYFGNDIHQAPDGSWLTEKTDYLGNTEYEGKDGNFIEKEDVFGNDVLTKDGEVVVSERDDAFGNNVLTDSDGDQVTELNGYGGVVYRGDVGKFGPDGAEPNPDSVNPPIDMPADASSNGNRGLEYADLDNISGNIYSRQRSIHGIASRGRKKSTLENFLENKMLLALVLFVAFSLMAIGMVIIFLIAFSFFL